MLVKVLRDLLLYLSRQRNLRHFVEKSAATEKITRRFVAGDNLDEGVQVCKKLNAEHVLASLDHLGENVSDLSEALGSRGAYLEALSRISRQRLQATISVKLTQLGLDLSENACRANLSELVCCARETGTRVEIDMEASEYVDRTLRLVSEMHARYGSVRAVIQAYLYRSEADIDSLCEQGVPVRLCKGAYQEPANVAFPGKAAVDANYIRLMERLFDRGTDPAIASHDETMLSRALYYANSIGRREDSFEFQMLYGIRRDLQRRLQDLGYRLRLYVPYGDAWYPYFMRRLAERPANLIFLARNLVRS